METDALYERVTKQEGIYGWCRKGAQDWRVFWVGGSGSKGQDYNQANNDYHGY